MILFYIVFWLRKELFAKLREKISPRNKEKVESLIKRVKLLARGTILDAQQKKLDKFLNK